MQAATDRGNSNRDYMIPVIDPNKAREDKQKLAESRYMSSFSQILKEISAEDNKNSQVDQGKSFQLKFTDFYRISKCAQI